MHPYGEVVIKKSGGRLERIRSVGEEVGEVKMGMKMKEGEGGDALRRRDGHLGSRGQAWMKETPPMKKAVTLR